MESIEKVNDEVMEAEMVEEAPRVQSDHERFVSALRDLADFYDARPTLPIPCTSRLDVFALQPEDTHRIAKLLGKSRKEVIGDSLFVLKRQFGQFSLEFNWTRETVCERIVVGTEQVEVPVMVQQGTKTETRDKVEWRCPKITAPKLEGR